MAEPAIGLLQSGWHPSVVVGGLVSEQSAVCVHFIHRCGGAAAIRHQYHREMVVGVDVERAKVGLVIVVQRVETGGGVVVVAKRQVRDRRTPEIETAAPGLHAVRGVPNLDGDRRVVGRQYVAAQIHPGGATVTAAAVHPGVGAVQITVSFKRSGFAGYGIRHIAVETPAVDQIAAGDKILGW